MRFACRIACMMLFAFLAACITTPDEVVMAPIHQALTAGNATKVERAAADRGQLAALNEYGETPLFYAVKQRKPDFVDILLSKGANVNAPNPRNGETPLIAAIRNNDESMVKRLLTASARPDQADNEGTTPLQWAIRKSNLTLVKTIATEVGTGKVSGQPAAILEASAFGRNEALGYLLSIGSPVNARSARGETPLILAARFGHDETVRLLLVKQAEVNALDKDGASALTWAARMGRPSIVSALVDAGAALDPVDSASFSPLAHAVRLGHAEVVALLVARNADVNLKLPKGASMLYWAAFQDKIAEQLYDTGARVRKIEDSAITPLSAAVRYLWLARFYEDKLLNKPGREQSDKESMQTCYEWAAAFFDEASKLYDRTASDLKSAEQWAAIAMIVLAAAADTASQMRAEMQARQMAEIGALGKASSQGTGLAGYYSALDSYQRSYIPPTTTPHLAPVASGVTHPVAGDSAASYSEEAEKCRRSAAACREIVKCYELGDPGSAVMAACARKAHAGMQHLR